MTAHPLSLSERIVDAAESMKLLVVSDFDGTLAGFSTEVMDVPVNERSTSALAQLSLLPDTFVAILSGRDLDSLTQLVHLDAPVMLVGSHGAESSSSPITLNDDELAVLKEATRRLEAVAERYPGSFVEHKPFHRVFHTRPVKDDAARETARSEAREILADLGGTVSDGKELVEFAVVDITKGTWIDAVREQLNCDCVVFVGDDVTDEHGFAALGERDLGIKVGDGDTKAHARIDDSLDAVADVFDELYQARSDRR